MSNMLHCDYIRFKDLIKQGKILSISPKYKLKNESIMEYGNTAVVSQEKDLIVGYTDLIDDKLLQPPYFIFGDHTEITKFIDFPFVQGADGVKIYKGNGVDVITEYLYYAVNVCYNKTGFYERHSKYLARTLIPIPNLDYQLKIVNYIKSYDDLIRNNENQIKILEEMADKLYKEWFVYFRFPTKNQNEISHTMPLDWEIKRAQDVFDIKIGRTPSRTIFEYFSKEKNGNMRWVSIADMKDKIFIDDTSEYLTPEAIKKVNMPLIKPDTVILSFKLTVGKVAITTDITSTNEAIAHFNTDNPLLKEYTYLYLKNFNYSELGNTSAIGNAINSTIVKKMPFVLPTEQVLEEFNKYIKPIFDEIKKLTDNIKCLMEQRDLLLPRLMSGKLSV